MNINTSFISNNNSYSGQTPVYIVIHNTDNYAKGANAKAHAKVDEPTCRAFKTMILIG